MGICMCINVRINGWMNGWICMNVVVYGRDNTSNWVADIIYVCVILQKWG